MSNESLTGADACAGTFTGGLTVDNNIDGNGVNDFEVAMGVVLGSGQVTSAEPPNSADNTTTNFGTLGDADLNAIVTQFGGTQTFDACVLEFEFTCPVGSEGTDVEFRYNFTSEEYNEFTNTVFTDVFAWFLNGSNIALLPDGFTPVQINTVNGGHPNECTDGLDNDGDSLIDGADPDCTGADFDIVGEDNSNSAFYNNNDSSDGAGGDGIEADGYTDTLVASGPTVSPGPNTMKLAIADTGDAILDSWAFIEGGSFECVLQIKTDAKPGSNPNCLNTEKSKGVISVAYYGSEDFDVTTIDQTTLTWGGAEPERCAFEDAFMENPDGTFTQDGITDLVCKYRTQEVDLPQSGDDCELVEGGGFLNDGTRFDANDLICVAGDPVCERGEPI